VLLREVQFEGHTALDSAALLACLGPGATGREYDLAGLQALADAASACYRAAGYPFARVFVPKQDMQDGRLRLLVVEGRYGQVRVEGDATAQAGAPAFLAALKPGQTITAGPLERATLLLSDLPGWELKPVMQPGEAAGTGDLALRLERSGDPVRYDAGLDNHGNRYTGRIRLRAGVQMDSPFTFGDQLTLRALASNEDLLFGTLAYSLPLGGDGLRAQASLTQTRYTLGDRFESADADGRAGVTALGVSYPLLRSRTANLGLSAQWQHKRLQDDNGALRSRKTSQSLPLALNFDRRSDWLQGGVSWGTLGWTPGRLDLDAATATTDAASARSAGRFSKVSLDLNHLQALMPQLDASVRIVGQWADKNLDSSEKFSLGGADGVRAYPSGEATGDHGWMVQAELRTRWAGQSPYAFVDAGKVTLNAKPWAPGANSRGLAGAGVGVRGGVGGLSLDASLAWRVRGGAPQSDSSDPRPRVWVSMGYRF
jgi:hemolysin activation/secretion protein